MVKDWRYKLAVAVTNVTMLLGLGTGIAMAITSCPGDAGTDPCKNDSDFLQSCCVGGTVQNCTRHHYICTGPPTTFKVSGPYGCVPVNPITNCS